MNINNTMLKSFRKDFAAAVKSLEEKYEIKIGQGSISYSESEFSLKITCSVTGEQAEVAEKKKFEDDCMFYGFKPEDYKSKVRIDGKVFELIGFNNRSPKNNCRIVEVSTGKEYKCSDELVKRSMKNS